MGELRQNIITRDWVIIASERAAKPNDFAKQKYDLCNVLPYRKDCPFCAGNEHLTPDEIYRISNQDGWRVRATPNKYPALSPKGEPVRRVEGIQRSMPSVGVHEVIIEHPRHDKTTALLPYDAVEDILRAYRYRYLEIKKDHRVEAIIVFKNHGERAGTSLEHPHSQIAAVPVVPNQIRNRIEEAIRYFDDAGECVFCSTLKKELESELRIVVNGEHFTAFIPYAALSPFHMWIFPRRHASSFDEITDDEIGDLARVLKKTLAKLYYGLGNPDYNYVIRSNPTRDGHTSYFHWYISIIPRISRTAGFELGSGMFINSSDPEASAAHLRGIEIPGSE